MKLRNNWKRFFTLDRHHAAGFTLVELIVVIAILAILAGVAVPAYSAYVTKANKQADITLVDDIEHAITLAGYKGTFGNEGGILVVNQEGAKVINAEGALVDIEAGSALDKALIDTFGSAYAGTMKLKHDDWDVNMMTLGLVGGGAQDVADSTYYAGADTLMAQVKQLTDAASTILYGAAGQDFMYQMFGGSDGNSDFLNEVAGMYGYKNADGEGDFSKVKPEEQANMLVLAVAYDFTQASQGGGALSEASGLIKDFALFNAYAATAEGKAEGFDQEYNEFISALNGANGDIDAVADAFVNLKNAAGSGFASYKNGQGATDLSAFESMMTGLTTAAVGSPEQTKAGLANGSFFTAGLGNDLFNSYINAVAAMVGVPEDAALALDEMVSEGKVFIGIFYTSTDISIAVSDTLPVA